MGFSPCSLPPAPCLLLTSTEGKTECQQWDTDGWGGYERVLPPEVEHHIGKDRTQRLERTNGILRQQTGRWHRQQEAFLQGEGSRGETPYLKAGA